MELSRLQIDELKGAVASSLQQLYEKDSYLIDMKASERAVVFRFGLYFAGLLQGSTFAKYDIDCEFNRNQGLTKRLDESVVIPDLLVHTRNSNKENILVIEFKGYWNSQSRKSDLEKIIRFTREDSEYCYGLGIFIDLKTEMHEAQVSYYSKGEIAL